MKELPITFTAPMVLAILDGRKFQTRRVMNPQPKFERDGFVWYPKEPKNLLSKQKGVLYANEGSLRKNVPLDFPRWGLAGDRLWVKETFSTEWDGVRSYFCYKARGGLDHDTGVKHRWKSPRFMPRIASRIHLDITKVRVQRLQDISEEDAKAEGVEKDYKNFEPDGSPDQPMPSYRAAFCKIWKSIHGAGSWYINPWVWVIEFKKVGGI